MSKTNNQFGLKQDGSVEATVKSVKLPEPLQTSTPERQLPNIPHQESKDGFAYIRAESVGCDERETSATRYCVAWIILVAYWLFLSVKPSLLGESGNGADITLWQLQDSDGLFRCAIHRHRFHSRAPQAASVIAQITLFESSRNPLLPPSVRAERQKKGGGDTLYRK